MSVVETLRSLRDGTQLRYALEAEEGSTVIVENVSASCPLVRLDPLDGRLVASDHGVFSASVLHTSRRLPNSIARAICAEHGAIWDEGGEPGPWICTLLSPAEPPWAGVERVRAAFEGLMRSAHAQGKSTTEGAV